MPQAADVSYDVMLSVSDSGGYFDSIANIPTILFYVTVAFVRLLTKVFLCLFPLNWSDWHFNNL